MWDGKKTQTNKQTNEKKKQLKQCKGHSQKMYECVNTISLITLGIYSIVNHCEFRSVNVSQQVLRIPIARPFVHIANPLTPSPKGEKAMGLSQDKDNLLEKDTLTRISISCFKLKNKTKQNPKYSKF